MVLIQEIAKETPHALQKKERVHPLVLMLHKDAGGRQAAPPSEVQ